MGRAPCCAKAGLKRGRWTKEEDEILRKYIEVNGAGSWSSLPNNAGLLRCGKSCRLRWVNYLRKDLKRGNISPQEDQLIINLHSTLGNRWSQIACQMIGRKDNKIKNYWNSHLSRRAVTSSTTSFSRFPQKKTTTMLSTNSTRPPPPPPQPPKRKGRGRTSRAAMKKNKHIYIPRVRKQVILSTDLHNSNPKQRTIIGDSDVIMLNRENIDVSTSGLIPRPCYRQPDYSLEEPSWNNNNNGEMGSHDFSNLEKETVTDNCGSIDLLLSYNHNNNDEDDVMMDQNSWTWIWDWDLDF